MSQHFGHVPAWRAFSNLRLCLRIADSSTAPLASETARGFAQDDTFSVVMEIRTPFLYCVHHACTSLSPLDGGSGSP